MDITKLIFPELKNPSKGVYFIGIGGIGMSALARWFFTSNITKKNSHKTSVFGSDLGESVITQKLRKEGLNVKIGQNKKHIVSDLGLIIYSQAVKQDNPEFKEARRLGIPSILYSEAIGRLTRFYKTIAVAGTHGKSTTTAILSVILLRAGINPTVIVGTNLKELGDKNFRKGHSFSYLVLEADEFGRSFLHYSPSLAVITNIDVDHLDTYKNLSDIKKAFLKFIENITEGGSIFLNKDSSNIYVLKNKINFIAKNKKLKVFWFSQKSPSAAKIKKVINIPGSHNISNSLAAYSVAKNIGVSEKDILSAIASYHGSWRRMEYKGKLKIQKSKSNIVVYDDYAHHPTEIMATVKAFKEQYPHSPLVCVYQPHQALRLKKLWKDFLNAFSGVDILILLPIYKVSGRDKIDLRYTSETLAMAIKKKHPRKQVYYLSDPKKLKPLIFKLLTLKPKTHNLKPILVMMGAGDVSEYTKYLISSHGKK